jgi:hypothetical protein
MVKFMEICFSYNEIGQCEELLVELDGDRQGWLTGMKTQAV